MSCYLSSSCFPGSKISDVLEIGRKHNYNLEFSAPHAVEPLDVIIHQINRFQNESGRRCVIHNYFPPRTNDFVLNLASADAHIQDSNRQLLYDAAKVAEGIGCSMYGIHPGYLADPVSIEKGMFIFPDRMGSYSECLERVSVCVNDMNVHFEHRQIHLLLENLFPVDAGHVCLGCSWREIDDLMSVMPQSVGLLLDLGHLQISAQRMGFCKDQFLDRYLSKYGSRLYEVHLSENDSIYDQHLPVKEGSWQLSALERILTLADPVDHKRIFCLESRNSVDFLHIQKSLELINLVFSNHSEKILPKDLIL